MRRRDSGLSHAALKELADMYRSLAKNATTPQMRDRLAKKAESFEVDARQLHGNIGSG
jgi:hypothetical protein